MTSPINDVSVIEQAVFPNYPFFPAEISNVVFELLAKSCKLNEFLRLAEVSKTWKKRILCNKIFNALFKHHFSAYQHYVKRNDPPEENDFKHWYSNLHGTTSFFNVNLPYKLTRVSMGRWSAVNTDGIQWAAGVTSVGSVMLANLASLSERPIEMFSSPQGTTIQDVSTLGNSVGVLLSGGQLMNFDVSMTPPIKTHELSVKNDAERFLFIEQGILYRDPEGLIFYQSQEMNGSWTQLTTVRYTITESRMRGVIPFVVSKGGFYLTLSNKLKPGGDSHYWQLNKLNIDRSEILEPFTTDNSYKVDLNDERLLVCNTWDQKLGMYKLEATGIARFEGEWTLPHQFGRVNLIKLVKLWGNHAVVADRNGKTNIVTFNTDGKASVVVSRLLGEGSFVFSKSLFISPNGLNFIVKLSEVKFPHYEPGRWRLVTLDYSPFPSSLSIASLQPVEKAESTKRKRENN